MIGEIFGTKTRSYQSRPLAFTRTKRVELRLADRLDARLALARGEAQDAVRLLDAAAKTLPPRGVSWHWHRLPDHVPLWYELGMAYLAAGDPDAAAAWFRRVVESDIEHAPFPIRYVRSHYFLGTIHRDRGDAALAGEHFRRYAELWADGDLDAERRREAGAFGG